MIWRKTPKQTINQSINILQLFKWYTNKTRRLRWINLKIISEYSCNQLRALQNILQDNRWNDSYITCILHYHTCISLFIRKYLIFVPSFNFCRVFLPWSSTDRQLWSSSIINLSQNEKRGIPIINSYIEGDDICFYCCYLYEVVWVAQVQSEHEFIPTLSGIFHILHHFVHHNVW